MGKTISDIGEFGLIDRINKLIDSQGITNKSVKMGIGDDCASFIPRNGFEILITCDSMVEGRHYIRKFITPRDLGRRAMVMNISDIGAMGGKPLYALISLGLKKNTPVKGIEDIYKGFIDELNPFKASIIGGNITGSENIFIDITLIGEVEKEGMVTRSTAREGDVILVTGFPGHAAAGLRILSDKSKREDLLKHPLVKAYNNPSHRAVEGRAVAKSGCVSSMIDISDGLLGDLAHICESSGVGAEIYPDRLPVSDDLRKFCDEAGFDRYELIMGDSDDYELIITCPPDKADNIANAIAYYSNVKVTGIGRITPASNALKIVSSDGKERKITPKGWDHFKERGG